MANELSADSITTNAGGAAFTAEEVLAEMERQKEQKTSPVKNLLILGISLIVFFNIGLIKNDPMTICLIVGVLFIHEAGHWLGMRVFGYQNVQMFFIPMFGAAVSGRSRNVPAYQKAIVCLLGPVPGVLLGLCFLVVYAVTDAQIYFQIMLMLLLINAFNLLPFFPLDGGRFMHEVVFSRNRYIEVVFRVLAGLCIVGIAFLMQAWFLMAFGVLSLLTVHVAFKVAGVTREIKELFPAAAAGAQASCEGERELMMQGIVQRIRQRLGSKLELKHVAMYAQRVCDGITARPPRVGATVALLAVYVVSVLVSVGTIGAAAVVTARKKAGQSQVVRFVKPDGSTGFKEYAFLPDGGTSEFEIDPVTWLYHGPSRISYADDSVKEGNWYGGKWDGDWNCYDPNGQLSSIIVFDKGRFVCVRQQDGSAWTEQTREELEPLDDAYTVCESKKPLGPPRVADPNALPWESEAE